MIKRVEPNLIFLFVVMVVFAGIIIYCEHFFREDGQVFQVFAGILTGVGTTFLASARKVLGVPEPDRNGNPPAAPVSTSIPEASKPGSANA